MNVRIDGRQDGPPDGGRARIGVNSRYVPGTVACLMLAAAELALYPSFTPAGLVVFPIYVVLLICLPFSPFRASTALCMVGMACLMLPVRVECPTWYWGVWFALGAMSPACGSVVPAAMFSIVESVIAFASNASHGMSIPSAVTMSATFPVAAMVGVYFLEHARAVLLRAQREADRERIEQQGRILDAMRYLHDEVAGDITYAIQLTRLDDAAGSGNRTEGHGHPNEIERVLSRTLRSVRAASMDPQEWHMRGGPLRDGTAEHAHYRLFLVLRRHRERLDRLGFRGGTAVVGTPAVLTVAAVDSITSMSDEILSNIVSHGIPGPYSFVIIISMDGGVHIVSANRAEAGGRTPGERGLGLRLVRRTARTMHGEVAVSSQDGEWTVSVFIPPSRETLLAA